MNTNKHGEIDEKVNSLLSKMTLGQKAAQLQCTFAAGDDPSLILSQFQNGVGEVVCFANTASPEETAAYNRKVIDLVRESTPLHIPPIIHVEAVTGLNSAGGTIFPSAIGLGATFSPESIEKMGDIIRQQMLAVGYRQALSPVMDVARDPRWGRIGETYGEDPTLAAAMSTAYTKGLQGDSLERGVIATGKHFLGYAFGDGGLNMSTNPITPRELREVYAKPFQAAITKANLQAVMNSYGTIDNEVIIGSRHILTELLRDEMGFDGITVSDYMSIQWLVADKICPDMESAGIQALEAGLDVELPLPGGFGGGLLEAVKQGRLDEKLIDRAVSRVLKRKYLLGLFDNPYPAAEKIAEAYYTPSLNAHSLKCARESIVLLKNDGILPLSKNTGKIAVIGPHADSIRLLFGGYTLPAGIEMSMSRTFADMAGMGGALIPGGAEDAFVPADFFPGSKVRREREDVRLALQAMYGASTPTILASIKEKCPAARITYARGCDIAGNDRSGFEEALRAAKNADLVIMTLGGKYGWGDSCTIGEGIDSDKIGLTGVQEDLAREIYAAGTPTVLVHMDARPLSSEFIFKNFPAVIENWFPGITGGAAIADVLFGDYNPAGRLPVTIARNAGQIPIYAGQKTGNSYYALKNGQRLNRYVEGELEPFYYFGEGKSFTEFEYGGLDITQNPEDDSVTISCSVRNTGRFDGDEVVQLYVSDQSASMLRPEKEFAGCSRAFIKAGETKTIRFKLRPDQFAFLNAGMEWVVEQGEMAVLIGSSSEDIRLSGSFTIGASRTIPGHARGFYAEPID
ncbi:MAG: glycoside hydrolase family 3 C-terminal domain-containing protein [Treponema sp.]|nr:glycoside hydrolase family 3 C-terminal domain-containing protein [Treponema sp.]